MNTVLLTLDNVNLDGNCVMALLDLEYGSIKWIDSVEYLGITAVKSITKFNDFFIAIIECKLRESKICILSKNFECIEVIYQKEMSDVKSVYSDNKTILVGAKGKVWEIQIDPFGHFTGWLTKFTYDLDYICTSIAIFNESWVCSLFNESNHYGKIVDINSGKCLLELSGIPRSLIVKDNKLVFLDAHNSAIYVIENNDVRKIPINKGYLSAIREVNGSLLMARSAWRAYTRRSNGVHGNWQNLPKWVEDKSYPDLYGCDLIELDDKFEQKQIWNLSHIADEISGLIALPEITISQKTDAEAKRAILLKYKHQISISNLRKQLQ